MLHTHSALLLYKIERFIFTSSHDWQDALWKHVHYSDTFFIFCFQHFAYEFWLLFYFISDFHPSSGSPTWLSSLYTTTPWTTFFSVITQVVANVNISSQAHWHSEFIWLKLTTNWPHVFYRIRFQHNCLTRQLCTSLTRRWSKSIIQIDSALKILMKVVVTVNHHMTQTDPLGQS